ncbi:MAG: DinB family protein [Rhabdochlamydiaceae bacterium]
MTQHEIIKGRLDYARKWLNGVLPRLTQEMLTWAPTEGMRTIAGQLIEIIEVEAQLVPVMRDGKELSDDDLAKIIGDSTSLECLLKDLTDVRDRTLAFLETLTETELAEEVILPRWYGAYWPTRSPRAEHFRNIAEHEFYHVGQLISYMWTRGDNPYEW